MREQVQPFSDRQTMLRQKFEVFHYSDMAPNEVGVHHHDFYEIFFFLKGQASYRSDGQIYQLKPGDILLIKPMVLHQPIVAPHATVYERIILWVDKEYLNGFAQGSFTLDHCFAQSTNLIHLESSAQRAEMIALLGKLVRECYGSEYGTSLCAEGVLMQIMVELNRLAIKGADRLRAEQDSSPLVTQLLDHINHHYSENLSLEGLARQFFVSKYHLSHAFSKAVGTGVYRYIMLKRLSAAKQLLDEGLVPGEVCMRCGFKDYTSFYRAFKAEYGISPRQISEN